MIWILKHLLFSSLRTLRPFKYNRRRHIFGQENSYTEKISQKKNELTCAIDILTN